MDELTPRQAQILEWIRDQIDATGMPPTRAEIADALGFRSPNAAEDHLKALARKGAIEMLPGASRGIRILASAFGTGLPLIGRVAAGSPILAVENIEQRYQIDAHLFSPRADYLLRVRGLSMKDAVTVNPKTVIAAWTPTVMVASIHDLAFESGRWRLLDELGTAVAEVDCVCLANGLDASRLSPGLELTAVRGQATVAEGLVRSEALVFGGYAIPTRDGVMIGATHERGDTSTEPRPEEQARNLAGLASVDPDLAGQIDPSRLWDWCGVRATTSDYLPLAGEATDSPAGLWVLSGLGSRGFCLAPLLAEHIAARALGCPSPLPNSLAALVDPGRFAARARRRGRPERSKSE